MIPSGFSAIAWFSAVVRPCTEPWPSRIRKSHPMTFAASCAPSPAPCAPPFRWSEETYTISLRGCAAGPVVGPVHGAPGAVTSAMYSRAIWRYAESATGAAVDGAPLSGFPPPPHATDHAISAAQAIARPARRPDFTISLLLLRRRPARHDRAPP